VQHAANELRVAIIGGGATGTLMALALARHRPDLAITLIEPSSRLGRGLAYGTSRPEHRLNVLPRRLSAFSDAPDDFANWLVDRGEIASVEEKAFVRRSLLGEYFGDRLAAVRGRVAVLQTSVTAINLEAQAVRIGLASGEAIVADTAILATGHSWVSARDVDREVSLDTPVTILGTGLSMVDRWISLREGGHRGVITAVSRHGLSPIGHGGCPSPLTLSAIPLGATVSETMRWLRDLTLQSSDWRRAVDAIRPYTQALWQAWPLAERSRFLRHARRYWDVHRHRVAPDVAERLAGEIAEGTVRIVRSRGAAVEAHFDCRGYLPDWDAIGNPLLADLLAAGVVRPDSLNLGLDVMADCRLVGRNGTAWPHLFAIGPITRGRFWEIEAIPDIRQQCEGLSKRIRSSAGMAVGRA
jgi:uncharacterized NAD(P)/FAD-binding protein YdhS